MLLSCGISLFGKFGGDRYQSDALCFYSSRYFAELGAEIDEGIPFAAVEGDE